MANNYGLFFSRDNYVVRLPENPETLPVTRGTENDEYNVLGIGPIMVPRSPSLRQITIDGYFPGRPHYGLATENGFLLPEFYIEFFRSAMQDKAVLIYTPVRYYENGEPFLTEDQGGPVLVTAFDTEERGGETGDFYYTLELTEYKDYAPRALTVKEQSASEVVAVQEPTREIEADQLYVGATCKVNGSWYYTSYEDEPHGSGNGLTVLVSRIADESRATPYHITDVDGNPLGWVSADALQRVN